MNTISKLIGGPVCGVIRVDSSIPIGGTFFFRNGYAPAARTRSKPSRGRSSWSKTHLIGCPVCGVIRADFQHPNLGDGAGACPRPAELLLINSVFMWNSGTVLLFNSDMRHGNITGCPPSLPPCCLSPPVRPWPPLCLPPSLPRSFSPFVTPSHPPSPSLLSRPGPFSLVPCTSLSAVIVPGTCSSSLFPSEK